MGRKRLVLRGDSGMKKKKKNWAKGGTAVCTAKRSDEFLLRTFRENGELVDWRRIGKEKKNQIKGALAPSSGREMK